MLDRNRAATLLAEGLERLDIHLSDDQQIAVLDYLELLNKWNARYNLTAIRNPDEQLIRHIFDSFACIPHLPEGNYYDLGSGGGVPGIPLAIAMPREKWILVDSNGKKARFLTQCTIELGLENVEVVHGRAENVETPVFNPTVISRAFRQPADLVRICASWLSKESRIFALVSQEDALREHELPLEWTMLGRYRLDVPGDNAIRYLLEMGR